MPTVLITGLNGFVAVHTALVFLAHDWSVRGTVRSQDKADTVKSLPVFAKYSGKIDVVVVEDLINGDFSKALEGVEAVAHTASPYHFEGKDWASLRDPAVKGTTNVLEQAAKVPSIKAVAIVSSFAAIGDFSKPAPEQKGKVYTEADWNPATEEENEQLDAKSPMAALIWYCSSKKFAELAARDTQKSSSAKYSLAAICPPMILGPAANYAHATGEELEHAGVSISSLFAAMGAGEDSDIPPTGIPVWADVRNVAQAMFEAIVQKKNERYIIYNGIYDNQILANSAHEQFPGLVKADVIPDGEPDKKPSEDGTYTLDGSKAEKELGIHYISLDQMVKDTVDSFVKVGAIKA